MRQSPPIPQCLRPRCLLSRFSACNAYPKNFPGKTFELNWCSRDRSLAEPPPIRHEILNVSQIAVTFHGLRPPFFIQTWLQHYRRCPLLDSAHYSLSKPMCFRSVRCWRTMIPGKIFTSFAKFQGIVSVNDFRFPLGFQDLLQASLCFLWSFCLARICLDPLSGQVLHHDCISVIVSRFTSFTENFVICCYQVTKIFCTKYGSAIASSARSPCNFGPFTDLANFGLKGNEYKHCACPNPHFSWMWALKILHEKNWRVSLWVQELFHPQDFLWFLAATPGFQNSTALDLSRQTTGFTVLSWFPLYLFLDFWLAWERSWLVSRQTTGFSVLSSLQHLKLDTSDHHPSMVWRLSTCPSIS